MADLPESKKSFWIASTESPKYPELAHDVNVDVAIVGGGIAGLTTAYLLKQAGLTVAVVEKQTIGEGVSGNTTGKITSQHNLIYDKLKSRLGEDTARIYGEANQSALARVQEIISEAGIECDFRHEDSYVYTTDPKKAEQFQSEARTAASFGLPASFVTESGLPFLIEGAVKFEGQATFHIRKYLIGLAKAVDGDGSHVFEKSLAIGIRDGKSCRVKAKKGAVRSRFVVVATNIPTFPLLARGTYAVAEYPMQSYIVAGVSDYELKGMYISPDSGQYSIMPYRNGSENLLLVGGEGHVPGSRWNPHARYERLADYANKHFGVQKAQYRWTHRDYLGYDDMPLIGKVYPWSKNMYTATGFMKWGLTNATVAAMILCDEITDRTNPWAKAFYPHRFSAPLSIPKVIGEKIGIK